MGNVWKQRIVLDHRNLH